MPIYAWICGVFWCSEIVPSRWACAVAPSWVWLLASVWILFAWTYMYTYSLDNYGNMETSGQNALFCRLRLLVSSLPLVTGHFSESSSLDVKDPSRKRPVRGLQNLDSFSDKNVRKSAYILVTSRWRRGVRKKPSMLVPAGEGKRVCPVQRVASGWSGIVCCPKILFSLYMIIF